MAARAIVGIALGILFAPVIYILLQTLSYYTAFSGWFGSLLNGDFTTFFSNWILGGVWSMQAPIMSSASFPVSMIWGFGPTGSLLSAWLPMYLAGLVTWTIIGAWAGAIERSAGRGIGVGVGIWLGWLIIEIIVMALGGITFYLPGISYLVEYLLANLLTVIVVIVVAAIFGAMTKSEEF
jgi:hypothetical protein